MKILGIIPARHASTRLPGAPYLSDRLLLLAAALVTLVSFATGCKSTEQQPVSAGTEIKLSAAAENSPFKSYDLNVVRAVQGRWYELVGQAERKRKRSGEGSVIIQFRLMQDGQVKECKVMESNVGDTYTLLCKKAILDPAPFHRWPDEMARMVNAPYREIRFTFYYN